MFDAALERHWVTSKCTLLYRAETCMENLLLVLLGLQTLQISVEIVLVVLHLSSMAALVQGRQCHKCYDISLWIESAALLECLSKHSNEVDSSVGFQMLSRNFLSFSESSSAYQAVGSARSSFVRT